jgi:hypothetical protein
MPQYLSARAVLNLGILFDKDIILSALVSQTVGP